MKLLGFEFSDILSEKKLELLAVWALIPFTPMAVLGFLGLYFGQYCLFHTTYFWPLPCLYLIWMLWDRETCNQGGRRYRIRDLIPKISQIAAKHFWAQFRFGTKIKTTYPDVLPNTRILDLSVKPGSQRPVQVFGPRQK